MGTMMPPMPMMGMGAPGAPIGPAGQSPQGQAPMPGAMGQGGDMASFLGALQPQTQVQAGASTPEQRTQGTAMLAADIATMIEDFARPYGELVSEPARRAIDAVNEMLMTILTATAATESMAPQPRVLA